MNHRARISGNCLSFLSRQLSTMLHAGIPIVQALDMVQEKADDTKTKGNLCQYL